MGCHGRYIAALPSCYWENMRRVLLDLATRPCGPHQMLQGVLKTTRHSTRVLLPLICNRPSRQMTGHQLTILKRLDSPILWLVPQEEGQQQHQTSNRCIPRLPPLDGGERSGESRPVSSHPACAVGGSPSARGSRCSRPPPPPR